MKTLPYVLPSLARQDAARQFTILCVVVVNLVDRLEAPSTTDLVHPSLNHFHGFVVVPRPYT
ncbi:MAG TPA: hypothetical protein VG815_09805 [Chloroflexota bacterium]|nr:hypothetical protein [Chloroflexota bacterium]